MTTHLVFTSLSFRILKDNIISILISKEYFYLISMSRELVQLTSLNNNSLVNIENIYTALNINLQFVDNKVSLNHLGDLFVPKCIISNNPITEILIHTAELNIMSFIPDFIKKIIPTPYGNIDGFYIYNIPWNMFSQKDILIICSNYNVIDFTISTEEGTEATLYGTYTFLPQNIRKDLVLNTQQYQIKQIQKHSHNIIIGNNDIDLNFIGITKGFFLDNITINNIDHLKILYNGQERLSYDRHMLLLFVKQISHDLLYISLDNKPWSCNDFNGSINMTSDANISIIINSSVETCVKIYFIIPKILVYLSGCVGLKNEYSINKISLPIYQSIKQLLEK